MRSRWTGLIDESCDTWSILYPKEECEQVRDETERRGRQILIISNDLEPILVRSDHRQTGSVLVIS